MKKIKIMASSSMNSKNITFQEIFKMHLNSKTLLALPLLVILPNLVGMLNLPTIFGFKIHTFQYIIFIAAAIYGPLGGAISGGVGSLYTAFYLSNPYIAVGNIILGFMTGLFIRRGLGTVMSVFLAYVIQLPWLYFTDVYLVGMSDKLVNKVILGLLVSNIVWAILAKYTYKRLEKFTA